MHLGELAGAARRRWWVVALGLLLTTGLAAAFASSRTEQYEASATIAITPDPQQEQNIISQDALSALLATYAQTAESRTNVARAERLLGRRLPGEISTSAEEGSGILNIFGKAGTPEEARVTALVASRAFTQSIATNRLIDAEIVSPPVTPTTALQPRPPLIIVTGALLGLGVSLLIALQFDRSRRRVVTPDDLTEETSLPLLARLPRESELRDERSIVWTSQGFSGIQEQFRALRTNIEFQLDNPQPIIQVTSAMAGEGKSTVAANLALAFAQTGHPTVLVDGDLRRPIQHTLINVDNRRGFTNLLASGTGRIEPVSTPFPLLEAVPSGPPVPNSTEMLHLGFRLVAERLRELGKLIVVDSPPLLLTSDPLLIAPHVDGVILVVGAGDRKPGEIKLALERLAFASANVVGVVLNRSGQMSTTGYGYSYAGDEDRTVPGETDNGRRRSRRRAARKARSG